MSPNRTYRNLLLTLGAAATAVPAIALAEPVEVVYSITTNDAAGSKSLVPGTLGTVNGLRFTNFGRIFRSPTSNKWSIVGTTTGTPSTADQVFVLGSGLSGDVQIREGSIIAGGPEVFSLALTVPRVNDMDQWAICFPAGSITSTTNSRVLTWDGSNFSMIRINDNVVAVPGATYTGTFNGTNISNSGAVSFLASWAGIPNVAPLGLGGSVLLLNPGVDAPRGQMTPIPAVWNTFTADRFWQDATSAHYIILGTVGTDSNTNTVAVVDGDVKVQKGFVIPGATLTSVVSTINDVWMESNADWFVRGSNADGQFWLLRNGVVIAASGLPITPGSTELWSTSSPSNAFRDVKGDNRGNYVISGRTNNIDSTKIDVLVLNSSKVLARQSDPVDLNGNGLFDDDMYVHIMQADRSSFNNDGYYYFAARTKNGAAAATTNSSFMRVRAIALTCTADFNADGDIGTDADIEAFFACLAGNCCQTCAGADFNGDGDVGTDADIESFFRVLAGGAC